MSVHLVPNVNHPTRTTPYSCIRGVFSKCSKTTTGESRGKIFYVSDLSNIHKKVDKVQDYHCALRLANNSLLQMYVSLRIKAILHVRRGQEYSKERGRGGGERLLPLPPKCLLLTHGHYS